MSSDKPQPPELPREPDVDAADAVRLGAKPAEQKPGESATSLEQRQQELVEKLADIPEVSTATIWRESAMLIGAATAFLYVASHVFGEAYLGFYGVSFGFQGFGLSNLALIPFWILLAFWLFASWVYQALRSESKFAWLRAIPVVAAIAARPCLAKYYGASPESEDLALSAATLGVFAAMFLLRKTWSSHLKKIEKSAEDYAQVINKINDAKLDTPLTRSLQRAARYMRWRVFELKAIVMIACAYLIMAAALPAYAWVHAMNAARQDRYDSITPQAGARIPVYWVADRVVFLTFDGPTHCRVQTQIAGNVQSIRACSALVASIVAK